MTVVVVLGFLAMAAPPQVGALPTDVTIHLTSYFDADNTVSNNSLAGTYGGRLSFDGNLASQSGYVFAFWIVDGNVQRALPVDHEFRLTEDMELTAVFRPSDEYAGVFMDSNLNLLGVRYANTGNAFTLNDNGMALPGKPGYLIANPRWNRSLTLTDDTVLTLQYERAAATTYSLTVTNGSGTGSYTYDEVVTVTADAAPAGQYFQHWERDGQVLSTQSSYAFTMLGDAELTAIYDSTVPILSAKVSISDTLHLRNGYTSYLGQMDVPAGSEIVEFGMLTSPTEGTPVLDNGAFTKYQGGSYHPTTKEFLHSFTASFASIRAYLVLSDESGTLSTYYSETHHVASGTSGDLFFSEYIEGASYNKAIELYNPTDQAIDLSEYTVNLYSNGSPTVSQSVTLSGTLASGDVYVIYHGSAAQSIIDVGDLLSSSVANWNGDDTIELVKNGVTLDVFGQIGFDPGSAWTVNGVTTVNRTLVRKAGVTAGDPNGSDAFDPSVEWDSYAQDTVDYLGSHTMTGFPLSGGSDQNAFQPGSAPSFIGQGAASILVGESYDPLSGVTATDAEDGDLTDNISYTVVDGASNPIANPGDFSTLVAGTYTITLQVSDSAGNKTTTTVVLSVSVESGDPSGSDTTAPMVTPDPNWVVVYSQHEPYVDYGCTALDDVDGTVDCTTTGTVDTSVVGDYTITFTATDTAGNTASVEETIVVLRDASLLDIDLDPYYDSAEGLYGEELLLALRAILNNGATLRTYGEARYILDETDADPNISGNLILIYLGTSVSGVWDAGATWNREHIWPQSLLGVTAENSRTNEASDLHNLAPADPGTNSSRLNKYYANATTTVSYAPRAAVRGDIARSLFYMIVMYEQYTLVDGEPALYQMGDRATLLQWYYDDPVDAFEQHRNNVIASYQNNRNPFVDYVHLLELIYYDEGLPLS